MPSGFSATNTTTDLKRGYIRGTLFISLVLWAMFIPQANHPVLYENAQIERATCKSMGWFPTNFGLKDHTVFFFDGQYYIVSNILPSENRFAYARSKDLCSWEQLDPVLPQRISGTWDEMAIWAPFVMMEDGTYYLYFTGVTKDFTQSIMLATSDNPANPESWRSLGMVFQPDHPGMNWLAGTWADCRDPTVIRVGNTYYLYYTGRDSDLGIIGLATSESPQGPWRDWGATMSLSTPNAIPESSTLARNGELFYLFYNKTSLGEHYRIGASPAGPWTMEYALRPGWAHEFWRSPEEEWYTSYLTDYTITISPLTWDSYFDPPRPFIGSAVYHIAIPLVVH
jgi:beta-xylosidase